MISSLRVRMMIAVGTLAIAAIVAVALTARQRTRTEFRRFQALTKIATSANGDDGDAGKVAAVLEKHCCDSASLQAAAAALSPRDVYVLVDSANHIIAKFGKPLEGVSDLRLSRAGQEVTIYLTQSGHGKSAARATLIDSHGRHARSITKAVDQQLSMYSPCPVERLSSRTQFFSDLWIAHCFW